MAAIVLAAAASSAASSLGAGTFFAAVAGGAGGFLGGFIDRAIFGGGKAKINQEGSRLTDLMVQSSTYGKAIPVVYGNARIAGNVIWSQPIQEHVTTSTQSSGGGKGGGGGGVETTTTSYTYTASLALNGTVRPVIAYSFFALYASVKAIQFSANLPWLLWTAEDQAIFAGIISFYFGQRAMSKLRGGK